MMPIKVQETIFQVERLKHIVGIGNSSAYQIYTTPGESLGQMGNIVDPAAMTSSNDGRFETDHFAHEQTDLPASLFTRMLSAVTGAK